MHFPHSFTGSDIYGVFTQALGVQGDEPDKHGAYTPDTWSPRGLTHEQNINKNGTDASTEVMGCYQQEESGGQGKWPQGRRDGQNRGTERMPVMKRQGLAPPENREAGKASVAGQEWG